MQRGEKLYRMIEKCKERIEEIDHLWVKMRNVLYLCTKVNMQGDEVSMKAGKMRRFNGTDIKTTNMISL